MLLLLGLCFLSLVVINNSEVHPETELKLSSDYIYEEGRVKFLQDNFCEKLIENGMKNCYGYNPSSPYGIFTFEHQDSIKIPNNNENKIKNAFNLTKDELHYWHLTKKDAIIIYGLTPPEHKYFSFTPYLMTRYGRALFNVSKTLNENHRNYFNSLTPTINNKNVIDNNKLMIIISTDKYVLNSLVDLFSPRFLVNTIPLPSEKLHLGLGAKDDTFSLLFRMAFPLVDDRIVREYRKNVPLKVFRVTDVTDREHIPTESKPFPPREQGWSEYYYKNSYTSFIENTIKNITKEYNVEQIGPLKTASKLRSVLLEGHIGIKYGWSTLGDCPDAIYLSSNPFIINKDEIIVVTGVNHAKIKSPYDSNQGKSVYSSITLYNKYLSAEKSVTIDSDGDFYSLMFFNNDTDISGVKFIVERIYLKYNGTSKNSYKEIIPHSLVKFKKLDNIALIYPLHY